MSREEAIAYGKECLSWNEFFKNMKMYQFIEMAIQALSQEPCDDAVSREELLKAIDTWDKFGYTETGCFVREPKGDYVPYIHYDDVIKCIKALPPVTPQQKYVKWIKTTDRLPEDKTYVLTTIKVPNRVAHARSGWYECGFFHNDNGDTWRATDMEVKAWMPLPEPYEPQESEE